MRVLVIETFETMVCNNFKPFNSKMNWLYSFFLSRFLTRCEFYLGFHLSVICEVCDIVICEVVVTCEVVCEV